MTYCTVSATRRRRAGLLLALSALLWIGPTAWAGLDGPDADDRYVTRSVVHLLLEEHLTKHPLDDEISQRCLKTFLKSLDPWKVYFYQSDVDAFSKRGNDLDDMVRKGDVSFAYTVFRTFLRRIDERVKLIDELLGKEFDFAADEVIISDRELTRYARTVEEARDKWRRRIKYELLVLKVEGKEGQEARDKLARRYHSFQKRMHQTDGEELLEMYLSSLTTGFDPHTSYMSPSTLENFRIWMKLELEGIGASLQSEEGETVVKKIIPGGAADRQGELQEEDRIVGVGQDEEGEIVDTVDMKLSDVVKLIRGKRGTKVRLKAIPVDSPKPKIITITRDKIELKEQEAQSEIFPVGRQGNGEPYNVGVVSLPSFYMDMEAARIRDDYKSTTRDVRRILENFKQKGVDAVVLDLRRNGGGSLTEAIQLTGLFIDEGPVVQVKDGNGRVRPYYDPDPSIAWSGPVAVLTSKFSASASEILAGAVQDYQRGLIIGDVASHGKGTVQSLKDLGEELFRVPNAPEMGALKITMQQFYRPNGESTQNRGVLADVTLPSLTNHLDVGEADLDYALAFDKVLGLKFKRFGYVNRAFCDELNKLSEQRREGSEDFQKVLKNIARYKEQKARKQITLNEEKFLKDRADINADEEEKKTIEDIQGPDQPAIERNYYLDEALAITVDYLKMMQVAQPN